MAVATSQVVAGVASLAATIAQHRAAVALGPAEAAAARSLAHDLRSLAHDLLALAPERPAAAPPAGASQAAAAEPLTLLSLPPEMLVAVLQWLGPHELARVERVARAFHFTPPPPPRPQSLIEQALRQRAAERGAVVPAALPASEASVRL